MLIEDIINNVNGLMSEKECKILYKLALWLDNNKNIVEIGSYKGRSSCCLAAGALYNNSNVYCIDIWDEYSSITSPTTWGLETFSSPTIFEEFKHNILKYKLNNTIQYIKGDSNTIGLTWNKEIDLLLIDGDHSYTGIKKDYEIWSPFVVKNGIILFHDYNSHAHPDVKKYIDNNIHIIKLECIEHLLITTRRV